MLAEAGLLGAAAGLEASGPRGTLTKADALRAAAAAPDSRGQGGGPPPPPPPPPPTPLVHCSLSLASRLLATRPVQTSPETTPFELSGSPPPLGRGD